jgi:hypothetical protein
MVATRAKEFGQEILTKLSQETLTNNLLSATIPKK